MRRGSDGAEQDVGFDAEGVLDVARLEDWLSGADGYLVRWYSQVEGEPDLVQTNASHQPRIASEGTVTRDSEGRVAVKFDAARTTYLDLETALSTSYAIHDMMAIIVGELASSEPQHILAFTSPGDWSHYALSLRISDGGFQIKGIAESILYGGFSWSSSAWIINSNGTNLSTFTNHARTGSKALDGTASRGSFRMGASTKNTDYGFDGYIAAFALFPGQQNDEDVQDRYDVLNAAYGFGPAGYNRDAILPQTYDWQVALYNWLKTIAIEDVTLPEASIEADLSGLSTDEVADLWLMLEEYGISRVTNALPDWYVLDAGNGKGIEATGEIRLMDHTGYLRSSQNEPAYLYALDLPGPGGTQGNGYYQNEALGLRSMVMVAAALIELGQRIRDGGSFSWTDMYGKNLRSWVEAYRHTKEVLPVYAQEAMEEGFEIAVDRTIQQGARGANTNMDTFVIQAFANLYLATDDPMLKAKTVQAVKEFLFGYPDGVLDVKHDVRSHETDKGPWAAHTAWGDYGVFAPAGYIMEGDAPEVFYNGESLHRITAAYMTLMDRDTGAVPANWQFLGDVLGRMVDWRMYQFFADPGRKAWSDPPKELPLFTSGAGLSGRTGAGEPYNQADEVWRDLSLAATFDEARPLVAKLKSGGIEGRRLELKARWEMENDLSEKLGSMNGSLSSTYEGDAPVLSLWSPWPKDTPYLPPKGWYSSLQALVSADDPSLYAPSRRTGYYYNKAFGGPATGDEFWAYKNTDGTRDFGWFVETVAKLGIYAAWTPGKIESFWVEGYGLVVVNRHGKGGCNEADKEDSSCWSNLDYKAGQHVWGRDENGDEFTTLFIRGRTTERESIYDLDAATPSVEMTNYFNERASTSGSPHMGGERNQEVIEGDVTITNRFEALSNGIRVTHELASDETDEMTEMWASLPIYLRAYSPDNPGDQYQSGLDPTLIEFWDGAAWQAMPEDTDSDGMPELVSTTSLRLTRDYQLGDGPQHVYVAFPGPQSVRLSTQVYEDPYQTKTSVRTVHIDLHGNPGTVQSLPASKSLTYTVQTTDPTQGGDAGSIEQEIHLGEDWNLASRYVEPSNTSLAALLAGECSHVEVVKNSAGDAYVPEQELDEIGEWRPEEAYQIFVDEPCTIMLSGPVVAPVSVNLPAGWSLLAYPLRNARPVEEVLSGIADHVVLVKDGAGGVYAPAKGVNTIGQLQPGQGYRIFVNQDVTLTYEAP